MLQKLLTLLLGGPLAAALALPSGNAPTPQLQSPAASVSHTHDETGDSSDQYTEPRNDLQQERPIDWTSAKALDENTVEVIVPSGTPRCYGTRLVVKENSTEVAIGAVEGILPNAPLECTMEARNARHKVTLTSPLNNRPITHLKISDNALKK